MRCDTSPRFNAKMTRSRLEDYELEDSMGSTGALRQFTVYRSENNSKPTQALRQFISFEWSFKTVRGQLDCYDNAMLVNWATSLEQTGGLRYFTSSQLEENLDASWSIMTTRFC